MAKGTMEQLSGLGDSAGGVLDDVDTQAAEELRASLLRKTGIDFANYINREVVATLTDLLLFPKYVFLTVVGPPFLFALAFGGGAWLLALWQGIHISGTLLIAFAMLLGAVNGILWAPSVLIRRIGKDLGGLADFALKMTESLLDDMGDMVDFAQNPDREWPRITEVFQGVVFIIMMPSLLPVVRRKIPLLGHPIAWVVRRVFGGLVRAVCARLDATVENVATEATEEAQQAHHLGDDKTVTEAETTEGERYELDLSTAIGVVEKVRGGVGAIVRTATRIAALPFRVIGVIATTASVMLLLGLLFVRTFLG